VLATDLGFDRGLPRVTTRPDHADNVHMNVSLSK
jgi:hypothetical protein